MFTHISWSQSSNFSISAQAVTLPLDSSGLATLSVGDINVTSSSSSSYSLALSDSLFGCDNLGANSAVVTAVDALGNVAYDTVDVTIIDNLIPWNISSEVSLYLDSAGSVSFDSSSVYQTFNDNCNTTFNFTPQVFSCGDVGAHLSSVSSSDASGGTASKNIIINVKDSLSPWISLFTDTVLLNASGQGTLDTAAVIDYIRDNCGIQTIVFSDLDFSASNLGLNTITVSVTDVNNNQSVALTDIWVIDPLAPNVKAKDILLPLDAGGQAVL
ncbi:MAG: hypothetical protein ACPG5D_00895, partial [Schleiferiaceae bacterium]